ncbi:MULTISPECIES: DUF6169 family protein [Flavobacterium]|nr:MULTISPECIES: DUF6169 family protein [Flavobacterium]MBB6387835.1 hypothetical protein [Flavobacterium notoginsengisoli]
MDFNNDFFKKLYAIDFYESNNQKFFSDPLIEITIIAIIQDYFKINPDIILNYVCDNVDFRQDFRQKLFDKWYRNAFDNTFSKINFQYEAPHYNLIYHLSFILKTDFYNIEEVIEKVNLELEEFTTFK